MSWWTHIRGTIEVSPMGRTQPECDYILNTILEHLPVVTGSEKDMTVHVTRREGHNCSSSHDEFGRITNNLKRSSYFGMYEMQDEYLLTIEADLRDRMFEETKKEFLNWLVRLAKRIWVRDVLVRIWGYGDEQMLINLPNGLPEIQEKPSWANKEKEPCWAEYLMWEREPKSEWPLKLIRKYIIDPEIDEEIERRETWEEKCQS